MAQDRFVDGKTVMPEDAELDCNHGCGKVPHRYRPSPEAGPHWRCSECGSVTVRVDDVLEYLHASGQMPDDATRLRRFDAYWAWYARQKQERQQYVDGAVCFAAGAEHEARVLAERETARITELEQTVWEVEKENLKMLDLATKCAGVLQKDLGSMRPDMMESLLIRIHEWITRNRG